MHAARRMGRDLAQLHVGHDRQSQGRRLPSSRRRADGLRQCPRGQDAARIRSICGRCRCSTATAGAFPGRCRWSPARMSACAGCARRRCTTRIAEHKVTHLCGAPIVMSTLHQCGATPSAARCRTRCSSSPPPRRRPKRCWPRWPRPGFNVTHVYGLTETYGPAVVNEWKDTVGRARPKRRARGEEGAPGRALSRAGCADRDGSRDDGADAGRWRDARRSDVPRQHRDEGLSEESARRRRKPSPAAGSIPAISA